jgi:hypothetical protein
MVVTGKKTRGGKKVRRREKRQTREPDRLLKGMRRKTVERMLAEANDLVSGLKRLLTAPATGGKVDARQKHRR